MKRLAYQDFFKDVSRFVAIAILICSFGVFIYPGLYKYDKFNQSFPVKINRITGNTQILTANGWQDSKGYNAALVEFEEYKKQIETALQNQNEDIKNSVLESLKKELEAAKNEVISATSDSVETGHMFDDVRARISTGTTSFEGGFSKGDNQETVKEIMGTPDRINKVGPFETWFYGASYVKFEDEVVQGWDNGGRNLLLK